MQEALLISSWGSEFIPLSTVIFWYVWLQLFCDTETQIKMVKQTGKDFFSSVSSCLKPFSELTKGPFQMQIYHLYLWLGSASEGGDVNAKQCCHILTLWAAIMINWGAISIYRDCKFMTSDQRNKAQAWIQFEISLGILLTLLILGYSTVF